MSEGIAIEERRKRATRSCQHHWVIETPHGVTSRGMCKRCGTTRRFPNAAEDAIWESRGAGLRRWSSGRSPSRPTEITLPDGVEDKAV
ncbi:MAG: hypothetical protein IIB21_05700 [Chloroflexi bacterium]|nr:hypothetical protein [Chloroflexota bacterium]